MGIRINVQKRKIEELADIEKTKTLIQELQFKSSPEISKELELLLVKTIQLLREDFEDLLKLQIDADIEEVLKLQKIKTLILILQRLNIREPIPKLRELESKCRIWVAQDQRTDTQLEILTRKLEEQTIKSIEVKNIGHISFKLIINPHDPDFLEWFENSYKQIPEYKNHPDAFESKEMLLKAMHEEQWFLIVAKIGQKVVGGIYFGYYLLDKGKYAIGHSAYNAIRPRYRGSNFGTKLVQLSEYYLRKIAAQRGYRLIMIIRFIPIKLHMPRSIHDRRAAKYLKKLKAKRLTVGHKMVPGHEPYVRLLAEWRKRKYIRTDLWLDIMWIYINELEGKDPDKNKDFNLLKNSLRGIPRIKLEYVNL